MTGLKAYDALKAATASLPQNSEFAVHPVDALDLQKLLVSDLESRDYDHSVAEKVSGDLLEGNLTELGSSMGLQLTKDSSAPRFGP